MDGEWEMRDVSTGSARADIQNLMSSMDESFESPGPRGLLREHSFMGRASSTRNELPEDDIIDRALSIAKPSANPLQVHDTYRGSVKVAEATLKRIRVAQAATDEDEEEFGFKAREEYDDFREASLGWTDFLKKLHSDDGVANKGHTFTGMGRTHSMSEKAPTFFEEDTRATSEGVLDKFAGYMDQTLDHLDCIFGEFDMDDDDSLSPQEFRAGLQTLDIYLNDEVFNGFYHMLDVNGCGEITFSDFEISVRRLKMLNLFNPAFLRELGCPDTPSGVMSCLSYNFRDSVFLPRIDVEDEFIFLRREPWVSRRWVHVNCLDPLALVRLAVKYHLHPLAVEDALSVTTRPKADKYTKLQAFSFPSPFTQLKCVTFGCRYEDKHSGHYFVTLPVLSMRKVRVSLQVDQRGRQGRFCCRRRNKAGETEECEEVKSCMIIAWQ